METRKIHNNPGYDEYLYPGFKSFDKLPKMEAGV